MWFVLSAASVRSHLQEDDGKKVFSISQNYIILCARTP